MESFPSSHNQPEKLPTIDVEEHHFDEEIVLEDAPVGMEMGEATPEQVREALATLNTQIEHLKAVFTAGAHEEGTQTNGLAAMKAELDGLLAKRAALEEHLKHTVH